MKEKEWIILKHFLLSIMLIGTMVILGGCKEDPQKGEPGGEAPTVITIWHSLEGNAGNALKEKLAEQMAGRPDIILRLVYVEESRFASLAYQSEAGGQGAHIYITTRPVLDQLYRQGSLAPAALGESPAYSAAKAQFTYNGTLYAQPWLTDIPMLYFQRDAVQAPGSWRELLNQGVALTAVNTQTFSPLFLSQGGSLWDGKNITLNKEENKAIIEQLLAWKNNNQLIIGSDALSLFINGQVNFAIGSASWADALNKKGVSWGAVPLTDLAMEESPIGDGNLTGEENLAKPIKERRVVLGDTIGIANSILKSQESLIPVLQKVEEVLVSLDVQAKMAQATGYLPVNPEFYQNELGRQFAYSGQVLANAWVLEGNAPEWVLIPVQDKAWSMVINEGYSVEDALNFAQEEGKKALFGN